MPLAVSALTLMLVSPELAALQETPLSIERNTPPPSVPANALLPLTASARTFMFVSPALAAVQIAPPSERNTPPPLVPASRLVPLTVRA